MDDAFVRSVGAKGKNATVHRKVMENLNFVPDEDLKKFYFRVVSHMISSFGISESEALRRVAQFARGASAVSAYLLLHRSVAYWAEGIYYKFDGKGEMTNEPKPLPLGE